MPKYVLISVQLKLANGKWPTRKYFEQLEQARMVNMEPRSRHTVITGRQIIHAS